MALSSSSWKSIRFVGGFFSSIKLSFHHKWQLNNLFVAFSKEATWVTLAPSVDNSLSLEDNLRTVFSLHGAPSM